MANCLENMNSMMLWALDAILAEKNVFANAFIRHLLSLPWVED